MSLLRSNAQAGPIGHRPDSKLWIDALVAQGIEQDGPNVKVGGSIPSGGTNQIFSQTAGTSKRVRGATTGGASLKRGEASKPAERSDAGDPTSLSVSLAQGLGVVCPVSAGR